MASENPESIDLDRRVDRTFVCTNCGYAMVQEVEILRGKLGTICLNCGEWTLQQADDAVLVDAARDAASTLAGEILTERQALAYLLREMLDADRQTTADVMESSPSNVDNLQRRGAEKIEDAKRVVARLEALRVDD